MILPGVMQEIADVIGQREALFLIGQLPTYNVHCKSGARWDDGKRVMLRRINLYVPKCLKPGHRLVTILGEAKAQMLVDAFGGENFVLPNCREVYVRFRDGEIQRMSDEGMRAGDIADIIGVSARTIRNLTFTHDNVPRAVNDNAPMEKPHGE